MARKAHESWFNHTGPAVVKAKLNAGYYKTVSEKGAII